MFPSDRRTPRDGDATAHLVAQLAACERQHSRNERTRDQAKREIRLLADRIQVLRARAGVP